MLKTSTALPDRCYSDREHPAENSTAIDYAEQPEGIPGGRICDEEALGEPVQERSSFGGAKFSDTLRDYLSEPASDHSKAHATASIDRP